MKEREQGFTVWIVGLSSAGKSTLAHLLEDRLNERGSSVVLLEPSSHLELKSRLMPDLGFDKDAKNQITLRLGYVARLITQCGGVAIVPWISPEQWARDQVRKEIGRFVEVYIQCPLEVCSERDDRGLYIKAQTEGLGLPGVHDPWEPPANPEVTVYSDKQTPEQEVAAIVERLESLGYLRN